MSAASQKAVFLHGWCGHGDEVAHLRGALGGRVLAPSWMPAAGTIDLDAWPAEPGPALDAAMARVGETILEQVRQSILEAGFAGSILIGHSMGGAMACVLAADPALAARGLVLIDSSVPMPPQRRRDNLRSMGAWLLRCRREERSAVQRAWIDDQPSRTAAFFHADDRGPARHLIERRMAQAPVAEAAAALGGYVQWPIDAALQQLRCPVLALAADPARLDAAALRRARPDATIRAIRGSGHFLHVFAAERLRAELESWLQAPQTATPRDPRRWDERYRKGGDGWELGQPAPPLAEFLRHDPRAPAPGGPVLVPGCGRGHEAALLAELGFSVVGLDFSGEALREARRLYGPDRPGLRWLQADLFDRDALEAAGLGPGSLAGVLEHTCFCAIDPPQRGAYRATVAGLLRPGGWLLGLFWCHSRAGGPPWGSDPQALAGQWRESGLVQEFWEPALSSAAGRSDEWLGLWRRPITPAPAHHPQTEPCETS
jgi:thiopurine S-methyltransferase